MELRHVIAIITLSLFLVYFFKATRARRSYLLFIVYFLPFMDLSVTSEYLGSFTIFDALSYFIFLFLIKDFFSFRYKKFFLFLFSALILLLFIESLCSEFIRNSIFTFVKFISIFIYAKLLVDECYENKNLTREIINGLKF